MYEFTLTFHSILRWVVVISAIYTLYKSYSGFFGNKKWDSLDDKGSLLFSISMDLQVLIGLLLFFFISPVTQQILSDFGFAMKDSILRYWAVEHITIMIIALALIHIGRAKVKKAGSDKQKHKLGMIFYTIAVILILAGIPWSFFSYGRPLI
ncbi:MAG: hypothetical protein K9J16_10630 [Melioribacteraceae bacterium]|nr:hypothetical protein [Melioribacteraceae bacterium]MCF8354495.1 hypothetical protein [Melioribacteraceae bacterium]MCF8394105.1 hypothetical protein [Melioribacteraceae bacterium]MCF8419843.1 hypothetical protein [Melioribacteraceae bacterium]